MLVTLYLHTFYTTFAKISQPFASFYLIIYSDHYDYSVCVSMHCGG
jgi:hypothetical protein